MGIDIVQKFVVEVDSMQLLEQYMGLGIRTALKQEEIAVKVVDRGEEHLNLHLPSALSNQDKHFPVIFIGGWYLPHEGEKNSYFNGYGPWKTFRFDGRLSATDIAIEHIKRLFKDHKKEWMKRFQRKFGNGYNNWFNHFDGSVEFGYELRTCGCFPEWLAISIVHIYYGK